MEFQTSAIEVSDIIELHLEKYSPKQDTWGKEFKLFISISLIFTHQLVCIRNFLEKCYQRLQ